MYTTKVMASPRHSSQGDIPVPILHMRKPAEIHWGHGAREWQNQVSGPGRSVCPRPTVVPDDDYESGREGIQARTAFPTLSHTGLGFLAGQTTRNPKMGAFSLEPARLSVS